MRYLCVLMTNWPKIPALKPAHTAVAPYIKPITLVARLVYLRLAVSIMIVGAAFVAEIVESG